MYNRPIVSGLNVTLFEMLYLPMNFFDGYQQHGSFSIIGDIKKSGVLAFPKNDSNKFASVLKRANLGETIKVIVPVCPDWSHNEHALYDGGEVYTFGEKPGTNVGINYLEMIQRLEDLVEIFNKYGINFKVVIAVTDTEVFDVEESAFSGNFSRSDFLKSIDGQVVSIKDDLRQRGLNFDVTTYFCLFPEETWLQTRLEAKRKIGTELIQNVLLRNQKMYSMQCSVDLDEVLDDRRCRFACELDIAGYMAEDMLFSKMDQNVLIFGEDDIFTIKLMKKTPVICWR